MLFPIADTDSGKKMVNFSRGSTKAGRVIKRTDTLSKPIHNSLDSPKDVDSVSLCVCRGFRLIQPRIMLLL